MTAKKKNVELSFMSTFALTDVFQGMLQSNDLRKHFIEIYLNSK